MRGRLKRFASAAALAAMLAWNGEALACCTPEGPEEFVGPLGGWVTACSGLSGNGSANDATALQTCITALSSSSPTLYLPAPSVCYNITTTLTMSAKIGARIIGANDTTTPICWGGTSGGTMITLNGNPYSQIARLTWNGETTAGIIINQRWDGSTGQF